MNRLLAVEILLFQYNRGRCVDVDCYSRVQKYVLDIFFMYQGCFVFIYCNLSDHFHVEFPDILRGYLEGKTEDQAYFTIQRFFILLPPPSPLESSTVEVKVELITNHRTNTA